MFSGVGWWLCRLARCGTHWPGFQRCRSGVRVSSASREVVAHQAHQLRRIAGLLEAASSGGDWGGPAERECSRHIRGLEADLRGAARSLVMAAEYAGIHSVMARL